MNKVLLNVRLLLVICSLFISTSLFSQQLKDVIIVDIPLNCSKATAVEKLKQKGFELKEREENGDRKMLRYVKRGGFYGANSMVTLVEKSKKITEIKWGCSNINPIRLELEEELDITPYYAISGKGVEFLFYHWKGKTIKLEQTDQAVISLTQQAVGGLAAEFGAYGLVSDDEMNDLNDILQFPHSIIILSDEDAQKTVQQHKNSIYQEELKELRKEQQRLEREEKQRRMEEQQKRIQDSIERENQRRQDSIKMEKQNQERLRQKKLNEMLQMCKFLFNSDDAFESCAIKENGDIEREIKSLIVKRLQFIYAEITSGKELQKSGQAGKDDLIQICEMCVQLKNLTKQYDDTGKEIIENLYNYTERLLGDFVSGRSALNKAYKKTSGTTYSEFLLSYMNGK